MKKVLSIVLAVLLVMSLAACGSTKTNKHANAIDADPQLPSVEYNVTSLNEPLVIDTDKVVKITLQDLKASFEGSAIQIKNANSVQITVKGENELSSTGTSTEDAPIVTIDSNVDVIFFGNGTLTVNSTGSCIKSTGAITFMNGNYVLNAQNGNGIRADEIVTVQSGTFTIDATECIEATHITINGGTFNLKSNDDAINASEKSANGLTPKFTMNGGTLNIEMADGDTDAIDSNGDIIIHGGNINITARSAFDWDGNVTWDGGTITVNGEQLKEITNQFENEKPDDVKNGETPENGKPMNESMPSIEGESRPPMEKPEKHDNENMSEPPTESIEPDNNSTESESSDN